MTGCGWLVEKALNDMREASKAFQTEVHRIFAEDSWVMVKTVPCLACNVRRDTLCGFCGDDFCTEGEPSALDDVDQTIVECFNAKIMPPVGPGDAGEGTVLRRLLMWNETGFSLQPDPKHFQNLAELLEVSGVNPAPTPISKGTGRTSRDELEPLGKAGATLYRRCVGICIYLGPERYQVQFTVKGLASDMQAPTRLSMARLLRLVRDLCGALHIGTFHMNQDEEAELTVWTDGDRRGDVQTCKSTPHQCDPDRGAHGRHVECQPEGQPEGCVASVSAQAGASPSSTCSRRSLTTSGSEQRYRWW